MKRKQPFSFQSFVCTVVFFLNFFLLQANEEDNTYFYSINNWYVGNTQAGEWIKFNRVWLSDGFYRFTARAVAIDNEQSVHLEIDGTPLKMNVPVPSNEKDEFELVHLGALYIQEGSYEVKFLFETGGVNLDMIFIKKENNNTASVLPGDIDFSINREDGMHIFAIGGPLGSSASLAKGGDFGEDSAWKDQEGNTFNREQVLTWYKQYMYSYAPTLSDYATDIYVSEQVEAKVDVIFCHGRGEPEQDPDVSITDRRYIQGDGNAGCMYIKKLVDAINRSEFARDQLKIAYFVDNAPFHLASTRHFGEAKSWSDPEYMEFVWNYAIKTFYEMIPDEMLFKLPDGSVPMQWWSANANYDYDVLDNKILEFFEYIQDKMLETFNLQVYYILDGTFFSRDPRTRELAEGQQAWFTWCGEVTSMVEFKDKYFAFALNGGRLPLVNIRLTDWNPLTDEGTLLDERGGCHFSSLLPDRTERIRGIYEEGFDAGAEWLVLESWGDWREGSTWYRSDHPEYAYPNQYISLTREFADRESGSIVLEAEDCDEYHSLTKGNSGGAYRVNWYNDLDKDFWHSNKEIDLNIYRPLHKLSPLYEGGDDQNYTKLSAGLKDVWAVNQLGTIYSQEVDGYPVNWQPITPTMRLMDIIVKGENVWGLTLTNEIYRTTLPTSNVNRKWYANECNAWQLVNTEETGRISKIALNNKEAFVVNQQGKLFYRDLSGRQPWQELPGENLKAIVSDDQFVWAMTEDNHFVVMSTESRVKWDTIANPYALTQIDASAGEVWGVNAKNEVYRINSSGHGRWQFVNSGFRYVSVGYEFVWLIGTDGKLYRYRMAGFEPQTAFVRRGNHTGIRPPEIRDYLSLQVFPNPFSSYLRIDVNCPHTEKAQLKITDINGKSILTQSRSLVAGSNEITLSGLEELPKGVYFLDVTTNRTRQSVKLIK